MLPWLVQRDIEVVLARHLIVHCSLSGCAPDVGFRVGKSVVSARSSHSGRPRTVSFEERTCNQRACRFSGNTQCDSRKDSRWEVPTNTCDMSNVFAAAIRFLGLGTHSRRILALWSVIRASRIASPLLSPAAAGVMTVKACGDRNRHSAAHTGGRCPQLCESARGGCQNSLARTWRSLGRFSLLHHRQRSV